MNVLSDPSGGPGRGLRLTDAGLDRLMPMHLWIASDGQVLHAGPTLVRLAGGPLAGRSWPEVVSLRRPCRAGTIDELITMQGVPLKLALNAAPELSLKGVVVALPGSGGALLNLSLGISLIEAVGRFDLTLGDFTPTDLAVELLYLNEAKAAVTGELERMARRLDGARLSAEVAAATDMLTGLANRRGLDGTLSRLMATRRPFGLMHVDLDYFKDVNDSLGHAAGDAVLQTVAARLRAECRSYDLVARVGGDEFVILLIDLVEPEPLKAIAMRLIERLEQPIDVDGTFCQISASIGIALSTRQPGLDPARLMHEADLALYESKRQGRARATLASDDLIGQSP